MPRPDSLNITFHADPGELERNLEQLRNRIRHAIENQRVDPKMRQPRQPRQDVIHMVAPTTQTPPEESFTQNIDDVLTFYKQRIPFLNLSGVADQQIRAASDAEYDHAMQVLLADWAWRDHLRQVRRDMRYLARVLKRMNAASGHGVDDEWQYTYGLVKDAKRRLSARYDEDTLTRMQRIICRTYRLGYVAGMAFTDRGV